jgi:serine/threonine-protein kinase
MPNIGDAVDRYVIEAVIGEGGMGRVYRALDPRLGRRVALKVLLADGASEKVRADAAARMLREARAAAAFSHANVVAIHDVGETDGAPYITMELVSGSTLRGYVGDATLPNDRKLAWLLDVARGLAAAHRAGLVHRDIKPENVMVTIDGAVKILDFGIARRTEDPGAVDSGAPTAAAHLASLTAEGMMIGTPQYMPPEQLQGEPLDGRADQFAWGVMAWELFAGSLPWGTAKNGAQLVAAVLASPVRPLVEVVPAIDPHVSDVVARALSKQRDKRFPAMEELLAALEGRRELSPLATSDPHVALRPTVAQPGATPPIPLEPTKPSMFSPHAIVLPPTTGSSVAMAASVPRSEPEPPVLPSRRPGMPIAIGVVGLLLASAAGVGLALRGGAKSTPGGGSGAPAGSAPAGPLVAVCAEGTKRDCSAETRAWCDTDDHVIACCSRDLVATGKDGVCDCPPGGSEPDAGATTCARAKGQGVGHAEALIGALRPAMRACMEKGEKENQSLSGSMIVELRVAPDGRVYRARIKEGRLASAVVQKCVLDELRRVSFDPPAGGTASLEVPIRFAQDEAGGP